MSNIVRAAGPWEYYCRKVDIGLPNRCWNWTASCGLPGYGNWYYPLYGLPKAGTAHRRTYMLFNGFVASTSVICHTCNNRKCCNPDHLYKGTHKTNAIDRIKHGTAVNPPLHKGSMQWNSKLTKLDVETIFALLLNNVAPLEIARKFNVSRSSIYKIKNGKNWKWL